MSGRSIPIIFGLEGAVAILALGVVVFVIGKRQQRRDRDVTAIPWVSPTSKVVAGSFLALYGLINIIVVYLAS